MVSPSRRKAIEREARKLLRSLYENKHELWPVAPADPLALIEPPIIAKYLGIRYSEPEEIPPQSGHRRIAGLMDREKGEIAVLRRQKLEVRRFTAAHEIGHWILHPGKEYFRDLPLDGSVRGQERLPEEREANLFAIELLMPEKWVRQEFRDHFGLDTLARERVDEDLVQLLNHGKAKGIRAPKVSSIKATRQLSMMAVQCLSLRRPGSPSLAERFRVSPGAMAIRLEELDLLPVVDIPQDKAQELSEIDVFISYKRNDRPFVKRLVADLMKRGIKPWYDVMLIPGRPWRREIDKAVVRSRSAMIILGSLGCQGYQDLEIEALVDEFLEKDCPIIPTTIPGWSEKVRIPFCLKAFQRVDLRQPEALEDLIQAILATRQKKQA